MIVVKYGGNAMGEPQTDPVLDDIAEHARGGARIVLVHGGGPQIDAALAARGLGGRRINGLRVTDAETLAVTESVLCATVNKALVRALQVRGARAVGLSGQDGGLLIARTLLAPDGESLGFVGEIVRVEPRALLALLDSGFIPVVAPLALSEDGATALNVNGDTAAGAIAGALQADIYVAITDVDRARRDPEDPTTGIDRLSASEVRAFLDDRTFGGGMAPKMESILRALGDGARSAIVCRAGPGALTGALEGRGTVVSAT